MKAQTLNKLARVHWCEVLLQWAGASQQGNHAWLPLDSAGPWDLFKDCSERKKLARLNGHVRSVPESGLKTDLA